MGVEIENDSMYHYHDITLRVYEDGTIVVDSVDDIGGNVQDWEEISKKLKGTIENRVKLMEGLPHDVVK